MPIRHQQIQESMQGVRDWVAKEQLKISGGAGESALPSLPPTQSTVQQPTVEDRMLPELKGADPMTLLQAALKDIGGMAARQGKMVGTEQSFGMMDERYGISPGDLPAGSIAQMMATIDQAMVDPVQTRLETISGMISTITESRREMKRAAESSLDFFIANGMWNELDSTSKQDLWDAAGLPGNARNVKMPGVSATEILKYDLPGFTPEWSYLLTVNEEPPNLEEWRKVLEEKWKSEGKMPRIFAVSKSMALSEWHKIRRNLESYGDIGLDSLPTYQQTAIAKFNEDLKRLYKEASASYDDIGEEERARNIKNNIPTPGSPTTIVSDEFMKIQQRFPELARYINLPYK